MRWEWGNCRQKDSHNLTKVTCSEMCVLHAIYVGVCSVDYLLCSVNQQYLDQSYSISPTHRLHSFIFLKVIKKKQNKYKLYRLHFKTTDLDLMNVLSANRISGQDCYPPGMLIHYTSLIPWHLIKLYVIFTVLPVCIFLFIFFNFFKE